MSNVFGILGAGQRFQYNFEGENNLIFTCIHPDAGSFDHLFVFIQDGVYFNGNKAGSIFYRLSTDMNAYYYLGMISNEKRSVLARIHDITQYCDNPYKYIERRFKGTGKDEEAEFTILIEDLDVAKTRISNEKIQNTDYSLMASRKKPILHLYNYLVSFAHIRHYEDDIKEALIPIQAAHSWYKITYKRMLKNPLYWNFLRTDC